MDDKIDNATGRENASPDSLSDPLWLRARVGRALAASDTRLEKVGGTVSLESARNYLRGEGMGQQLRRLELILPAQTSDAARQVMNAATHALSELATGSALSNEGLFGLEALILLAGRPVLKTVDGDINLDDPRASEWRDRLYLARRPPGYLAERIAAVGRIDSDGHHVGTGFVVGAGLILTNRHVVQDFAEPVDGTNAWRLNGEVTIDFADAPNSFNLTSRFRVLHVVSAGPDFIDGQGNTGWTKVDAALLLVELLNQAGTPLPPPVPLNPSEGLLGALDEIVVIGYPARPSSLPRGLDGSIDEEVVERLGELFAEYGVRTIAPGMPKWSEARDRGWSFPHDATTLGGSSGSCVLSLDGHGVGLHFGGFWRHANYAHGLARLRTADTFLTTAKLAWTDQ